MQLLTFPMPHNKMAAGPHRPPFSPRAARNDVSAKMPYRAGTALSECFRAFSIFTSTN